MSSRFMGNSAFFFGNIAQEITSRKNSIFWFCRPIVDEAGSDEVIKPHHDGAHVWINDDKRFENVPKEAWEFYIGGYQPAQKWLKDRKGRKLSSDDVFHYQKIIKILCETHRIMETY